MYKFKVPATSANLGIGFDCMGIALKLYNYFEIEENDKWIFNGFIKEEIKNNNLFLKAYKKASKYKNVSIIPLKVNLKANISINGGLGSSSSLIVAGIYAFNLIHNNCLTKEEIFKIATSIEGHPDNVAPCIYGGLCIINNGELLKFNISNKWNFGIWLMNNKVSTNEARKILKNKIDIKDAVNNISSAIFGLDALINYKKENIHKLMNDKIHEPYRKKLIKDYDKYKKIALDNGALAFLISGSGSTCISISDKKLNVDLNNYKELKINNKGIINV